MMDPDLDRGARRIAPGSLLAAGLLLLLGLSSWGWNMLLRLQKDDHLCPGCAQVLAALYRAEKEYRRDAGPKPHYARLRILKLRGLSPVGEGEMDPTSGYTFTSSAGADSYTIVAIPPKSDMTTYSLMETGELNPPRDDPAWRRALGKE